MPLKSLCSISSNNSHLYTVTFKCSRPLKQNDWAIITCICCSACAPLPWAEPWKQSSGWLCSYEQAAPFINLQDGLYGPSSVMDAQLLQVSKAWWSNSQADLQILPSTRPEELLNRKRLIWISHPKILFVSVCRVTCFLAYSQWRALYKDYLLSTSLGMEWDCL